ncbi:bacterial Ig-like domain-containing protein [Bifidobacterium leontopitheci]|uniref:Carbohydrate-binding protein n=1 Tax=Bifidobacterium leontopitheci TaxID=2650774 RepID=A0A6I1GG20_9BIFI|nr:bacterial Ig-like domain-containing protein [Bifidobacterium leontopitheci]KAB7789642.1 carbohydrate-binding protein [Bifidobacterium leontopitheci]
MSTIIRRIAAWTATIATTVATGVGIAAPAAAAEPPTTAATAGNTTVITPNPWFQNGPFQGWGTSLAWFANATGSYGEEGSLTQSSGDATTDAQALAYGKALREQFYQSIFGKDGLDLNMARYNIGGGNASDVGYGYPYMRQGAAVPGYWADDIDGSKNLYGGVTTRKTDYKKLDEAFDATKDSSYDWSKGKAQEWWVQRGAETGDITSWEAFANSAPYFMTYNGTITGTGTKNQSDLQDAEKFGQYLGKVVKHLEDTYGINISTIEPFNESENKSRGTPVASAAKTAAGAYGEEHKELVERYDSLFPNMDKNVTTYDLRTKKPQEGMYVSNDQQQATIRSLRQAIASNGLNANGTTVISGTDASNAGSFGGSYDGWDQDVRDSVGQYNVHAYSQGGQFYVRDIAQADGKPLSMSEVDGDYTSEKQFNPYDFSNALGMAEEINNDVYALQSQDFTFWQVVEDLYNMQTPTTGSNPNGENLNWGTVFIDFDCTVAGKGTDGKGALFSKRRVDQNGGRTDGLKPCTVLANTKYNAVRAYTQFIHKNDVILANNDMLNTMTARSADDKTQTIVHRNAGDTDETVVLDLSKYGDVAADAAGKLYLTTTPKQDAADTATPAVLNRTSNQLQKNGVTVDPTAKTATFTVPAGSIASVQLTGVSGVSKDAETITDGGTYQLVGQQSGKAFTVTKGNDAAQIDDLATDASTAATQLWTFHELAASAQRPTVRRYVIESADHRILTADKNGTVSLKDGTVDAARNDTSAIWTLNTDDSVHVSLVNSLSRGALDVTGRKTAAGSAVGTAGSTTGSTSTSARNIGKQITSQTWQVRSTTPTGVKAVHAQTAVGVTPSLPSSVTPQYPWGDGSPAQVTWDTAALAEQVAHAGTVTVNGTATDLYGNTVQATATVYVGAFTVSDPTSITVAAGTTAAAVKDAAPATVKAHVGTGEALDTTVTWQWDDAQSGDVTDATFAKTGALTVTGKASDGANGTIPATLTVLVTDATVENGRNVAGEGTLAASYAQGRTPVTNLVDGRNDTAWGDWAAKGTNKPSPWVSWTFATATRFSSVDIASFGEATPKRFTVQYLDDSDTWVDAGVAAETGDRVKQGDITAADISAIPATKGIRLDFTYADGDADYYLKLAEAHLYEASVVPKPASVGTLADLRVGGASVDGFAPNRYDYDLSGTVDVDTDAYPLVQAFATDAAAKVDVSQPTADNGGKTVVTVTPADGGKAVTYTVDFGPLFRLSGLKVRAGKTTYQVGEPFDLAGLKVTAVYSNGKRTVEKAVAADDPELAVTGFDSHAAMDKQIITVTYRGVSASYAITVAAPGAEQPTIPSKPGDGTGGGGSGGSDGSGDNGSGSDNGSGAGDGSDGAVSGGDGTHAAGQATDNATDHAELSRTGSSVATILAVGALLCAASAVVTIARRKTTAR